MLSRSAAAGPSMMRREFAALGCAAAAASAIALSGCARAGVQEEDGKRQVSSRARGPQAEPAMSIPAGAVCVTEYAGNSLAVINPVSPDAVQRCAVGQNPAMALAAGGKVYVGSSGGGQVFSIDASQGGVRAIDVGNQPLGLCFDEARRRVYVSDYFTGGIHAIDVELDSVVWSMTLSPVGYHNRTDPPACCQKTPGVGRRPVCMALSPDGAVLYCANYGTYDIARVDVETGEELEAFDGVVGPRTMLAARDGEHLILAGVGGEDEERVSSLYLIDREGGTRVAEIPVGSGVADVCQTADGSLAYAISRDEGALVAFECGAWGELGRVALGAGIESMALSPDESVAYVADAAAGELWEVDLASLDARVLASGLANPKDVAVAPS